MNKKGFTLIELLVVIAIIGLLATFAVVQLGGSREKARIAKALAFSGQMRRIAADEAVGIWGFDECSGTIAYDSSGLANNATLMNAPTWSTDTPSRTGCSMQLDGVSQYAVVNNILPDMTSNTLTVSVWVKSATPTWNAYGWFLSARTSGAGRDFVFHPNTTAQSMTMYLGNGSSWFAALSVTPSDITVWHQYSFTYDGAFFVTYLDGRLIQKVAIAAPAFSTENVPLYIGSDSLIGGRYGSGWIDEVQIFNKTLTASEIQRRYAQQAQRFEMAQR